MWKLKTNGRVTLLKIAMIPCALSLTACGEKPVLTLPPPQLSECAPEPQAPLLPGMDMQAERDSLMIDYIAALRTAGGDCRAKVDGLKAWMETAGK